MILTQLFRPLLTLAAAVAVILAAFGMIGCNATMGGSSCEQTSLKACTSDQSSKFEQDRQAILAMAGEHAVTFDFEETMVLRPGYELKAPYREQANELVVVVADTGDFISLQHLLVVTRGEETHVVKHWRQDWQYQGREGYTFVGNNIWQPTTYEEQQVKGAWVQSVYQVDDSPRYWGIGKWEHRDGISSWSALTNRPLPRREHTKRSDYQVLGAVNTHVVTATGWMHYQHNHKIDRDNAEHPVIALESGINTYTKTVGIDFSKAREYWENTQAYWSQVRSAWSEVYDQRQAIQLKTRWNGDRLYTHLFDLADLYWGKDDVASAKPKVQAVIDAFRQPEQVAKP